MFSEDEEELRTVVTVVSSLLLLEESGVKKKRKKPRDWVKPYLMKRNSMGCHENLLVELRLQDVEFYRRFLRMGVTTYENLLEKVGPLIQKQDTNFRKSISNSEMISITLRHLATGESQWSLGLQFRVGQPTISKFILLVCSAIIKAYQSEYLKTPSSPEEWKIVAQGFETTWNFPHCIGALDGKHIRIQKPPNSSSEFYNYKKFFSVVLMALVDADLKFIYVDVGTSGRLSDGGVWGKCKLQKLISQSSIGIPQPEAIAGMNGTFPFVIVGDEAFPLGENLMRPFPGQDLSLPNRVFNYRLSRARRTSENAFGILASQWRILRSPINCKMDTIDKLILSICCLHNILRSKDSHIYTPRGSMDNEDIQTGFLTPGSWRDEVANNLNRILTAPPQRYSTNAIQIRNKFTEFFNSVGIVNWQLRSIKK